MKKLFRMCRNESGMTIMELMVVFTVLIIVVGAAMSFLTFSQRQFMWIDTDQKIQVILRETLQHMTINIRDAKGVILGSDTNNLVVRLPNMDAVGNIQDYDTITYELDVADSSSMLMELIQTENSQHYGWGTRISQSYDAFKAETTTVWIIVQGLANTDDHSSPPLFTYNETDPLLVDNASAVTTTLQVRKESSPGKFQTQILSTSIRLRNKRD